MLITNANKEDTIPLFQHQSLTLLQKTPDTVFFFNDSVTSSIFTWLPFYGGKFRILHTPGYASRSSVSCLHWRTAFILRKSRFYFHANKQNTQKNLCVFPPPGLLRGCWGISPDLTYPRRTPDVSLAYPSIRRRYVYTMPKVRLVGRKEGENT